MKKIIIAGGTGFLGTCIVNYYSLRDTQLVILTRGPSQIEGNIRYTHWDGKTIESWREELEGADVIINLNGKSVDCRYTERNKKLIYSSRVDATAAIGKAIQASKTPPKLWINASSATIYRHSLDREMSEQTGEFGSGFSVDVCEKWEATFNEFVTPRTRKILIRTGIVLGAKHSALKPLRIMATLGFGGKQGPGNQYCSWIHEIDFVRIIDYLVAHEDMYGVYNVTAPVPISNRHLMKVLRSAIGIPFGIPMPKWLLEIGAGLIRTETELILKSRRVIPKRLVEDGFVFKYPTVEEALTDLLKKQRLIPGNCDYCWIC